MLYQRVVKPREMGVTVYKAISHTFEQRMDRHIARLYR